MPGINAAAGHGCAALTPTTVTWGLGTEVPVGEDVQP